MWCDLWARFGISVRFDGFCQISIGFCGFSILLVTLEKNPDFISIICVPSEAVSKRNHSGFVLLQILTHRNLTMFFPTDMLIQKSLLISSQQVLASFALKDIRSPWQTSKWVMVIGPLFKQMINVYIWSFSFYLEWNSLRQTLIIF